MQQARQQLDDAMREASSAGSSSSSSSGSSQGGDKKGALRRYIESFDRDTLDVHGTPRLCRGRLARGAADSCPVWGPQAAAEADAGELRHLCTARSHACSEQSNARWPAVQWLYTEAIERVLGHRLMLSHSCLHCVHVLRTRLWVQEAVGQDANSMQELMERVHHAVGSGKVEVINITVASQKRCVLEAVAFGTFLRDVETFVDSEYALLTPAPTAGGGSSDGGGGGGLAGVS